MSREKMPVGSECLVPLVQSQITFPATLGTLVLESWVAAISQASVSSWLHTARVCCFILMGFSGPTEKGSFLVAGGKQRL